MLQIFTDGSCINEWEAKQKWLLATDEWWIWIAIYRNWKLEKEVAENYMQTTNNRMELLAILKSLQYVNDDTYIISDSQYALKSVWWYWDCEKNIEVSWWDRSDLSKVKNAEYIKAILKKLKTLRKKYHVSFWWVRWHSWNEWNEKADELSCKRDNLKVDKFAKNQ